MNDAELLHLYVTDKSETAFSELVNRHIRWVFQVALREMRGDADHAQEVTQVVFINLARKAAILAKHPALLGWLHNTTRFVAANVRRAEHRRRSRERSALTREHQGDSSSAQIDWGKLGPILDGALTKLNSKDREALLLRFFANQSFADIAEHFGDNENATRMRVGRALDKLHGILSTRGVKSTASALGIVLAEQAGSAVPAGLAGNVAASAIETPLMSSASTAFTSLMISTKLKLVVATALVLAGIGAIVVVQRQPKLPTPTPNILIPQIRPQKANIVGDDHSALSRIDNSDRSMTAISPAPDPSPPFQVPSNRDGSTIYQESEVDVAPTIKLQVPPTYSPEMKAAGLEGEVTVGIVVATDGKIESANVMDPAGTPLDGAALDAVRQWEFNPGTKGGIPVRVHLEIPIEFSK